ncbi:MAG: class I tRNA ligase family protein, partial [Candidatus Altiarchaeota archaeon]|nr:class I tRNA ligase family protein [Candidatus Altiarchaeota archaeon]
LLRVYQLTGKKAFKRIWISGHVVDERGKKMSKSIGNVVYPEPLVERYGADALRFNGAAEAKLGSDIRLSEERTAGSAKFVQKLYNVSRFISMFEYAEAKELNESDKWILSELSNTIECSVKGYEDMDLFVPANEIRNFVWDTFASHYIELVKFRAYDGDKSAIYTLHTVLKAVLKLIAPIMPFVTDYVYREMYGETVHTQDIPTADWKGDFPTKELIQFNEFVWASKKEKGNSLKDEIKTKVPKSLKPYESDLVKMHGIVT